MKWNFRNTFRDFSKQKKIRAVPRDLEERSWGLPYLDRPEKSSLESFRDSDELILHFSGDTSWVTVKAAPDGAAERKCPFQPRNCPVSFAKLRSISFSYIMSRNGSVSSGNHIWKYFIWSLFFSIIYVFKVITGISLFALEYDVPSFIMIVRENIWTMTPWWNV